MEQPFSTSKVTVEYFDPHDVYKLLAPGLVPRLPLHNLHWQSHAGPLRSIETLHVELVDAIAAAQAVKAPPSQRRPTISSQAPTQDDGFTTQFLAGHKAESGETSTNVDPSSPFPSKPYSPGYGPSAANVRRHQIPGLRRTPYLKVLLVRCDDNDSYKSHVRSEIREWAKENTSPAQSSSSSKKEHRNAAENHDAFEWLIIHVVVPNTVAATQPRSTNGNSGGSKGAERSSDSLPTSKSTTSRWRGGSSTPLLEKLRSDFNGSSKPVIDRIAQIRIGVNDVPYDILPRVAPALPTGYSETEADAEAAWGELIAKFKHLILSSFDVRVTQYEEDIKEKDAQRTLPGWNFCTFFILKEGLARGFESVGLVEDALVGYDELSVGLDMIIQEQAVGGSAETHGGSLLAYTEDLKSIAQTAMATVSNGTMEFEEEETVTDLQSGYNEQQPMDKLDGIPISVGRKLYRDLILSNNVSVFDFRCYIFARQVALLLRLGNAYSTLEELLAKLKEQQDSVLHGVAPQCSPPKQAEEPENLAMLAEICKRTLEFIPGVSQVMRRDVISALTDQAKLDAGGHASNPKPGHDNLIAEVTENIVASFAFSVAQQILAQTSTKALPIPPPTQSSISPDGHEPKSSIPEPKTMMHPARSSSLWAGTGGANVGPPLPSPNFFPGPGTRRTSVEGMDTARQQFLKVGIEELAARRADLYTLSRNILEEAGKKRGWSDGWAAVPLVGDADAGEMKDISLDDGDNSTPNSDAEKSSSPQPASEYTVAGLDNQLLQTALGNREDFYRLYETLTDKALRHYTVAGHTHSVQGNMADLAVLRFYLKDYKAAASYFVRTTPFYGESGWSLLEMSMLVMYSICLKELRRQEDYVRVVLKLLTKSAAAEKEKLQHQGSFRIGQKQYKEYPEISAIKKFLPDFLTAGKSLNTETKTSLQNFFTDIELDGPPVYDGGQDSFSLMLKLRSVLADVLPIEKAAMRLVSPTPGGDYREIWLENSTSMDMKPGRNRIRLRCSVMNPGTYEVDRIHLRSGHLTMQFERDISQQLDRLGTTNLKNPYVVLYQRADSLDLQVQPSSAIQLDQNNAMDLDLSTGWNEVQSCEVRIRSATGGLRLLTSDAKILDSDNASPQQLPKSQEVGLFSFSDLTPKSSIKIRIPFTVEQDVPSIIIKAEVKYTTPHGTFTLRKTPSVPQALKLGVNVQDVFKHAALFSKFTVSTATSSPLRLFSSSLIDSDIFESQFGLPPQNPVIIFPKQPASLLYKICRKKGSKIGPNIQKTMYLRLEYSVLATEIEEIVRASLTEAVEDTPLRQFGLVLQDAVLNHVRNGLTAYDLERAAMLGYMSTSFIAEIAWEGQFFGLGNTALGEDAAMLLAEFVARWTKHNPRVPVQQANPRPQSILIPVDVPSIKTVHTADISLVQPVPSLLPDETAICINQLLPANLHLKWTRRWDTDTIETAAAKGDDEDQDAEEFSYEVTAPADTWLLGGRRRGHFVIPGTSSSSENDDGTVSPLSSSPINEADIPILLIPLREGWLPYPSVEVREVLPEAGSEGGEDQQKVQSQGHCETDYKNLGETVRVVADRGKVTVSLDASGPGGGPLVLESERIRLGGCGEVVRVIA